VPNDKGDTEPVEKDGGDDNIGSGNGMNNDEIEYELSCVTLELTYASKCSMAA
jgi:hypothetical protein